MAAWRSLAWAGGGSQRSPATIPIPGTLSPAHLEENTGALLLELSAADLEELSSYQLSRLDARSVARRFVPPRLRRVAVRALGIRRRFSG
jgi:diketogulonate reductase-like aldo/keto reductase